MARAEARAVMRADNRQLKKDLGQSKSMFRRTFAGIGRSVKGALGGALGSIGVGAGALGLAVIGKEALNFEQTLADIEIQAGASSAQMMGLREAIVATSGANAQGRKSLADAALQLVNLQGKAGFSAEKMKVLSDAALATSAPVEELAGLIFSLQNSFGLATPEELEKGLSAVINAGKEGSVPLGEMNLVLQQISATFKKFSDTGVAGAADVASALQVLRKGFGTAAEAGTGLESLLGTFLTREVELGKAGIAVKDSAGNFRDLRSILADIESSGVLNDAKEFNDAFGKRKEARKALDELVKQKDLFNSLSEAARNADDIQEDGDKRRLTSSFRINKALNDSKERVLKAFTPERIEKFAAALEKLVGVFEVVVDNIGAFAAGWAGLKIAGMVSSIQTMGTALAGTGSQLAGLASGFGAFGAVAAGAGIGLAIGTAIEEGIEAAGIGEAIRKKLVEDEDFTTQGDTGFLKAAGATAASAFAGFARSKETGINNQFTDEVALQNARDLVRAGRASGAIGAGGNINRNRIFETVEGRAISSARGQEFAAGRMNPEAVQSFESTLQQALEIVKASNALIAQKQRIEISIDRNSGKLIATQGDETGIVRNAPVE